MEALAPEQRVCDEEIDDLVPAIIEDKRPPILVRAFARIFMLVKGRAIEPRQRPVIPRKMRRHPIDNHPEAGLVKRINEELKIIGCSVTAGRGKKTCHLVTPGRIKGMLGHRHELDMRESHFLKVLDQRLGQLAITE